MSKITNFFSLLLGKKQPQPQQKTGHKGPKAYGNPSYAGGQYGGAKWNRGLSASGSGFAINHFETRQNARTAIHEVPQARAMVSRKADTVVDTGIKLESTPDHELLGISEDQAQQWARKVESRFDMWCRDKKQSRNEQLSFYQMQRMYMFSQERDGECFTRLYYSNDQRLINPLQFQMIDPNQIRGDAVTSSFGPNGSIGDGIDRDNKGREIRYHVWFYDERSGKYEQKEIPARGNKSGRTFMLHGFAPEYAGQQRGFSRLAHAIQEFENLTDFTASQIKKAIMQSSVAMYVKPSQDNDSSQPFESITNNFAGPQAANSSLAQSPSETSTDEDALPVNYCDMPEATFDTPGSIGVFNLKSGEDLKAFENKTQAESFGTFVDSFMSYLSAASDIPVEVVTMKFGQNYSASRATLLLFWRVAEIWRMEMNTDLNDPIYEQWLSEEIAQGNIQAPGWSDKNMRAAWLKCEWIGAPMPNIDPMRTAKADKEYLSMSATTVERVARNLNGSRASANISKNKKTFSEMPVPHWEDNSGSEEVTEEDDG